MYTRFAVKGNTIQYSTLKPLSDMVKDTAHGYADLLGVPLEEKEELDGTLFLELWNELDEVDMLGLYLWVIHAVKKNLYIPK